MVPAVEDSLGNVPYHLPYCDLKLCGSHQQLRTGHALQEP